MSEIATQSAAQTLDDVPRPLLERASGKSFVAHAKLIGFFTLISRVLGLAREIVAGHYLGTGLVASAFTVSFTIPNLFRKLFGEGALSAAFIPLYAQALKAEKAAGPPPSLTGDVPSPLSANSSDERTIDVSIETVIPIPSPGTPGEGQGEGLLLRPGEKDPHPDPLPEYREREKIGTTNDSPSPGTPGEGWGGGLNGERTVEKTPSLTLPRSQHEPPAHLRSMKDKHASTCHPERSEGSLPSAAEEILRCAQDDGLKPSIHLQSSTGGGNKTVRTFLTPNKQGGSANDFAAASVNLLCAVLLGITIAGEILLGAWMLLERGMRPDRMLTLRLTAIMLPYVLLICGTAFLSGILQVHKRFGPPAFAPVLLNVCHIVVVFIGASLLGLHGRNAGASPGHVAALQTTLVYWLAFFVLVAGVLQWMVLLPALKASGFRFKLVPHFWTPMVRRMLKLTVPVAMGAGVLQLSVLLDKGISTVLMAGVDSAGHVVSYFSFFGRQVRYPMEIGAPARLNLAQFLYQFPLGVFAIALATAIFPSLAGDALDKDRDRFRSALRGGIEATLWEGIPASLGLILVRGPAIRLLFQHGQITAHDADLIGQSVLYYSGAIWAFSLLQIVNRAYYAIHDTVTPLVMSIVNIVLNLVVEIPLLWWLGESAMAVGTLVSFAIQAVVMLVMLNRKIGGLGLRRSFAPVVKMVAAAAAMGLACWGVQKLPMYPHGNSRVSWLMQLGILMTVGAGVYVGACAIMGIGVMEQIIPRRKSRAR
jgi:putative peptidoglycan lipid II flippase